MATRVLILNGQLAFAVKIKQALEQTGLFDVHPFTKADAAFDFLREHPQDVALVDFTLPGRSGAKVIQQMRSIQPDLAVVISPRQPEADVEALNLQGMIDVPFNARDVIPLLERAANPDEAPLSPQMRQTRKLTDESALDQSQLTTGELGSEAPVREQFGMTRRFDDTLRDEPEPPAQTRTFDDPDSPSYSPAQTRHFDDPESPSFSPAQTQHFDDPDSPSYSPAQTRHFDDPESPSFSPAQTQHFDNPESPSQIDDLNEEDSFDELRGQTRLFPDNLSYPDDIPYPPDVPETSDFDEPIPLPGRSSTRQFDNPPPAPPEISSLDEVLKSFGFEPPIEEQDTPPVPTKDSDAIRQYLATSDRPEGGDTFDNVLGAIDPDAPDFDKTQTDEFRGLVRSLQRSEPHTSLPGRQQQAMDFILTSGMDSVLREIEKTKTGPLGDKPSTLPEEKKEKPKTDSFKNLIQDEPPMPTLEENGTVSDLLVGINDRGFRNVLSLLRGDEVEESSEHGPATTQGDMDDAFRDFYGTEADRPAKRQDLGDLAPRRIIPRASDPSAFSFDNLPEEPEVDDEATVAQVVLRATLDESDLPKDFSVDKLMADIEDRLAAHKLNVRPLPSWDMDTTAFRAIIDQAEIREPSFLPEEMPPGELVPPEEQPTRASAAVSQWLEGYTVEPDADYLDETIQSEGLSLPAQEVQTFDEFGEPIPDNFFTSVEDEEEPERDDFLAALEAEPTSEAGTEFSTTFGTDHMFDDMLLPNGEEEYADPALEPSWVDDEEESASESDEKSPLDDFFAPPAAERNAPPPVEPTWIVEDIQPLPRATSEVPAVAPSWVEPEEENWELPPEPESVPDAGSFQLPDFDYQPEQDELPDDYPEAVPELAETPIATDDWSLTESTPEVVEVAPTPQLSPEEAYIAQLALNLTQVSLELSSEGSILTRKNDIVAFAGHISQEDAVELRDVIHNDWEVGSEGARLRFINLPSSGKDYMLYSIRTVNDLVLSMIFAGTTPLRVIRQQGQRLVDALQSMPETQVEAAAPPPQPAAITRVQAAPPVALDDYAYVWLLRDPTQHLSDAVSHAISTGLTVQLNEMSWKIQSLQVDENFIYLLAGVPGETPPYQIIGDLQRRSAEIASTQDQTLTPQNLWADSYLVLTPGREMSRDEIQEFIDFQRMM